MTAAASIEAPAGPIAIWLTIESLQPNPDQPRKVFDEEKLGQLTASIRARGRIVQPLVVRSLGDGRYELVCGERRWRAAKAAGLSEVPVIVRELSDQEAFEESIAENIDREDMAPIDEVRAVARLASELGVQETAKRLGKPHHWVSKRKRIAEGPAFVGDFLESGASNDIEALYELSKLADSDVEAAQGIIDNHAKGGHLREEVKAATRAARADGEDPLESQTPSRPGNEPFADVEPRLSHANGSEASDSDDEDDDEADGAEPDAAEPKPSWLPSDAPELDEPFDADPPIVVTAVEGRRAGHIVFTTDQGSTAYELTEQARAQLRALLLPS
jgi:ParB family transcriptional regulator, chromosome partitioning protein